MKKILFAMLLLLICASVFAEKITLRTGDVLGLSATDYFFPVDINVIGSKCSVTSIKHSDKDLWCISVAALRSGSSAPVIYDYYVKKGDVIKLKRISDPMKECSLKVEALDWNEAVLDVQ